MNNRQDDRPQTISRPYGDTVLDGMSKANSDEARRRFDALSEAPGDSQRSDAGQSVLFAAEERLALLEEATRAIGWWEWNCADDILHTTPGIAAALNLPASEASDGMTLQRFLSGVHEDDRGEVSRAMNEVLADCAEFEREFRMIDSRGDIRWVLARGRCYRDSSGEPRRFPGVIIDITEQVKSDKRKQALADLGERLRDLRQIGQIAQTAASIMAEPLDALRAGFGVVNSRKETVMIPRDWTAPGVESISGLHHFRDYGSFIDDLKAGEPVIIGDITTDPRTAAQSEAFAALKIGSLVNLPIIEHGRLVLVVLVQHQRARHFSAREIDFIRNIGDRTQAAIARSRAEEQRKLLNGELSHRLKNTLAMMQSIVSQSMRSAKTVEDASEAVSSRISALARAHQILLSENVGEASIHAIIRSVLDPHRLSDERIRVSGPHLDLSSNAALSLSLVLHELATNAAKYGALSGEEGQVDLRWETREIDVETDRDEDGSGNGLGDGDEDAGSGEPEIIFELTWTETGGPPVIEPTRKGFGQRLIRRGISGAVGGRVDLDWAREGLRCRFTAPLSNLVTRRAGGEEDDEEA